MIFTNYYVQYNREFYQNLIQNNNTVQAHIYKTYKCYSL